MPFFINLCVCTRYSVRSALKDSKGEKLFKLERKKLVKLFGPDEGQRLYSQITVQKKQNGVSIAVSGLIAGRNVHCLFVHLGLRSHRLRSSFCMKLH